MSDYLAADVKEQVLPGARRHAVCTASIAKRDVYEAPPPLRA